MAIFKMTKDFDNIQDAKLMPEDWYLMEVSKEPIQQPNQAMRDGGPDADKAGMSIVLRLKTVTDDPEFMGRLFTGYLSLPNASDEGEFVNGQPKVDWKEEKIARVTASFHGFEDWKELQGDEAEISAGMRAKFYVIQKLSRDGQKTINDIDLMNNLPRPA